MADISEALSGAMQGAAAGPWGALVGAGMGLLGGSSAQGDRERALELQKKQMELLQRIKDPNYQEMVRQYALLQNGGEYTPEQLVAEQMRQNYEAQVQANPELAAKQQDYLNVLEQVSKQGMTPEEAAQRNSLMRQMEASQQSKMADIDRQMAQQGMSSSGASLLAKMNAQQQSQNAASEQADALAAQMNQRRMAAQQQLAQQAGSMENLQYGRNLQKAQSKQALDQFNLQQRSSANQANVNARNQAQMQNLARQQQVSDANIATMNRQQDMNKQLDQLRYENEISKATGIGNAAKGAAAAFQANAENTYNQAAGLGKVVGGTIDYFNKK